MRHIFDKFTAPKAGSVIFGILFPLLFQSSSAASVVMVGFVDAAILIPDDWHPEKAMKMKRKYRKYALMAYEMEMQHYKRLLTPGSQSVESSKVHIELLNLLRMINSHE